MQGAFTVLNLARGRKFMNEKSCQMMLLIILSMLQKGKL